MVQENKKSLNIFQQISENIFLTIKFNQLA